MNFEAHWKLSDQLFQSSIYGAPHFDNVGPCDIGDSDAQGTLPVIAHEPMRWVKVAASYSSDVPDSN